MASVAVNTLMRTTSLYIAVALIMITACNSGGNRKQDTETTETLKTDSVITPSTESQNKDTVSIWTYNDSSGTVVKNRAINVRKWEPYQLVDFINTTPLAEHVHLDFVKMSHDTIYVKIRNSNHLTQEMGSSGADAYMQTATYTLTELKNIRFVNYDFKLGDHAAPGTYSRKYYTDRKKSEEKDQNKKQ